MKIFSITVDQLNKIGHDFGTQLISNMVILPGKEYTMLTDETIPHIMESPSVPNNVKQILHVFIQFLNYNQYNCSLIVK